MIETMVPIVLVNILSGLVTTAVFTSVILIFDWRIGLIALAGILLYLCVVSAMEKKSAAIADDTQRSQTALIEAVLETIQGMSVVKAFNLTGRGDKKLQDALEYSRKSNLQVESVMTPYTAAQETVLQLASVGMMLVAAALWAGGSMTLPNALMVIVVSFLVFSQVKLFGMGVSMLRLAGASRSGGEKQRISIARAMLKNAPLIILDEATANVDPENEDRLQRAIEALTHEKTVLMIAHRLKTVRKADQILVLEDGRLVQQGTHEEMLRGDGLYRRFIELREQAEDWHIAEN